MHYIHRIYLYGLCPQCRGIRKSEQTRRNAFMKMGSSIRD